MARVGAAVLPCRVRDDLGAHQPVPLRLAAGASPGLVPHEAQHGPVPDASQGQAALAARTAGPGELH